MASVDDIKKARPGELKLIDIRKNPDEQQIPGSMRADGEQLEAMVNLPFSKDEHVGSTAEAATHVRALRKHYAKRATIPKRSRAATQLGNPGASLPNPATIKRRKLSW